MTIQCEENMRTGTGNRAEFFLASSVPDLKLDLVRIDHDRAAAEFDSNGQIVLGLEAVVCESQQEARLADS